MSKRENTNVEPKVHMYGDFRKDKQSWYKGTNGHASFFEVCFNNADSEAHYGSAVTFDLNLILMHHTAILTRLIKIRILYRPISKNFFHPFLFG